MPIRIAHESLKFQKYQFFNELTGFIPSFSASWGLTYTSIDPVPTTANSRLFQVSLRYPVFLGGNTLYTALVQYYRLKGWRESYKATINDALLDVYSKYAVLVLNNALLQIRVKSYQFSEAQLELNNALYKAGTGTQFAIMQSRAQLAADEQALLQQQMATRQASMAVSFALNLPMSINLVPVDDTVAENALIDEKLAINELIAATHRYRPELKQYEDFRLAANRNIQVAASSFYPTVSFFTTYTHASSTIYPAGNSDQLNGVASAQVASAQAVGKASNTALNQTASFSPTGNNVGTSGANTVASVVASSGGNPIATTQSGGLVTSGAVAPVFGSNSVGGSSSSNVNGSNTASAGVFPGLSDTVQGGLAISWSLPYLATGYLSNIMTTKHLARQALLQSNQELQLVLEQVRFAYCSKVAAREQIDSAAYAVKSASEALRLATLRLRTGTGTNLELIQAQRDYATALSAQCQAIISSNQAQAQLLHDTGLISFETLTHGYDGKEPVKTR
jgi:outer membrane protein TolC